MKFKRIDNLAKQLEKTYDLHKPTIPHVNHFKPNMGIDFLVIDTEGTGLRWAKDHHAYGISLAWICPNDGSIKTAWFDFPVHPITLVPDYGQQHGLNVLRHYFLDPMVDLVFANAKYDLHMLEKIIHCYPVGIVHDVILQAWISNTLELSYKLDNLADKYGIAGKSVTQELRDETAAASKVFKPINPSVMNLHVMQRCWILKFLDHKNRTLEKYGRMDAYKTIGLHLGYMNLMRESKLLDHYFLELDVMHRLYGMEKRGVRINSEKVEKQSTVLSSKVNDLKQLIYKQAGEEFNLDSPDDKNRIFYGWDKKTRKSAQITYKDKLPLPILGWTDANPPNPSTGASLLQEYQHIPIIENVMQCQGYAKGLNMYNNYKVHMHPDPVVTPYDMLPGFDKAMVVNPTFNQMSSAADTQKGTRTGRLSGTEPNLTNVADATKSSGFFVQDARELFEPRPGFVYLFIDYSQVELRIFAERCNNKLKAAFLAGRDPHNETRLNVKCLREMDEERGRKLAKNTNFTVINCGGAGVLNARYGIPLSQGQKIFNDLHDKNDGFPEIRARQYEAQKFAEKHGYIETIFGRKIHVDRVRENGRYKYTYRSTSYDVQGSAADCIKRAIIKTSDFLKHEREKPRRQGRREGYLLLSVHDELVFEIKKDDFKRSFVRDLVNLMEGVAEGYMEIPLKCEAEYSTKSWATKDKKKIKL